MKKIVTTSCLIIGLLIHISAQISSDGLVGSWFFTGNAQDESGNNYHGTVHGAVLTEDRFGRTNEAYYMDGVDDYIYITNSSLISGSELTLSCWVKSEDDDAGWLIITGNQNDYNLGVNGDSVTGWIVAGGKGHNLKKSYFDKSGWNNLILRYNGSELQLILNNSIIKTMPASGSIYTSQPDNLTFGVYTVGGSPTSGFYKGAIDDILLYNRVLSDEEISDIYQDRFCFETVIDTIVTEIFDTTFIQVYDTLNCQSYNIAPGQKYAASIMDSIAKPAHNPRWAFDGDTTTTWHPQSHPPEWIDVHFRKPMDVDSLGFWYGQDPGGNTTQKIYSTTDSLNWTLIETITPYHIYGGGSYRHVLSNRVEDSKGIRVHTITNPSWVQWKEIMIWGKDPEFCLTYVYDTTIITETVYDTSYVVIQDTTFVTEVVYDTSYVTVIDSIAVADTLIIDAVLTGMVPPNNINTLKIYPNPANNQIFINTGDFTLMNGYLLRIINQLGVSVYETLVLEPLYEVDLSTWTGYGLYYIQLIDTSGNIIDIRKIVLQ